MPSHFINTRPNTYSDNELTNQLDLLGITSHRLPLLAFCQTDNIAQKRHHLNQLIYGKYTLLVVISVTAVNYAQSWLSHQDIKNLQTQISAKTLHVIAVGKTTAKALADIGITAQIPNEMSNEGMIQMPCIQALLTQPNHHALFWRGVGGRTLLLDTLTAHGVVVDSIAWYERTIPNNLSDNLEKLLKKIRFQDIIFVLISSEMAFNHWQNSLNRHHRKHTFIYLCLGNRLYAIVKNFTKNPNQCLLLDNLTHEHITNILAKYHTKNTIML